MVVAPGANNWNQVWPNLDARYVNIRNFVRDGQKLGAMGMLNTTWNDDGESLYGMAWPALIFGAAAGWQADESDVEQFKNSYDWAFYRNDDSTFRDASRESRSRAPGTGQDQSRYRDGRFVLGRSLHAGWREADAEAFTRRRDMRLGAEHALLDRSTRVAPRRMPTSTHCLT